MLSKSTLLSKRHNELGNTVHCIAQLLRTFLICRTSCTSCIVLHVVQCIPPLSYTVQCCLVLSCPASVVLRCTVQCCPALPCIVQSCPASCTVQCCLSEFCTVKISFCSDHFYPAVSHTVQCCSTVAIKGTVMWVHGFYPIRIY